MIWGQNVLFLHLLNVLQFTCSLVCDILSLCPLFHNSIIPFTRFPKSYTICQNNIHEKSANKNINQNTIFGYKSIKLIIEKNITSSPNPNLPTLFAILLVLFFFILKKISRDPFVGHYQWINIFFHCIFIQIV
jgi:hypothetical protein